VSLAAPVGAGEVCLDCQNPAASYRCTLDRSTIDPKFEIGDQADRHACEKVLTRLGPHGACKIVDGKPCKGPVKTVTLAEYQRAMTDNAEQTYQPSVLELAQRSMTSTWTCVASLFKNC
jgi:hypothetical protein